MIKISHEVPLCLLDDNLEWSDYQYCLPHLIDEYPQYKEHFVNYARNGGFVIMDNGLFEGIEHTEIFLLFLMFGVIHLQHIEMLNIGKKH